MSDNLEQAAILLLTLGEEHAAEILKQMTHRQVEAIVEIMNKMGEVNSKKMSTALNKFMSQSTLATVANTSVNSQDFIRKTLVTAIGSERAGAILDHDSNQDDDQAHGIDLLNWQQPRVIAEILQDEHPQVIAVVFSYLESEKAAKALGLLPKALHVDVLKRLSNIGPISPVALEDLTTVIQQQLSETPNLKEIRTSGVDTAAKIVNHLDSTLENEVISGITSIDEQLSQKLQERMFPFERLATVDSRSLQTLLRNVPNERLVLALKGAEESLRDIFFKNMSERAADMMKDDLEALGPVQLNKIEDAQKEIVGIAQRLAKEGQLILVNSGDVVM